MLYLREVTETDLPLLLAWRHNQKVMEFLVDRFETWDEHMEWFFSLQEERESYMVIFDDRPVGEVHAVWDQGAPEVGVYIGDVNLWGKGVGSRAIRDLLDRILSRGYEGKVLASVHPKNWRSQVMFKRLDFTFRRVKDDGYLLYERDISGTFD